MNAIFNMVPRADFITGEVAHERPILMSVPMVRAIIAGTKTQTRRIVKPQPEFRGSRDSWHWKGGPALLRAGYGADYVHTHRCHMEQAMLKVCPYGKKFDKLWVKETFTLDFLGPRNAIVFRADEPEARCRWKPSIFMRRDYSRITLEITAVRAERLQDISEGDAIAEGIESLGVDLWRSYHHPTGYTASPITSYETLWESIHGKGSWALNSWVWVLEFRRVKP